MMSLKDRCTHPKTHMPYLKTAIGGANVCPEGRMNVGFFTYLTALFPFIFHTLHPLTFYMYRFISFPFPFTDQTATDVS